MRYRVIIGFFLIALAFFAPKITHSQDYITDAVDALQTTRVYVAPGTAGTDPYTAGQLLERLKSGDSIVLVMLPADASVDTDIFKIASTLSEKLEDQYIIGLAVGREVIGYSNVMPVGEADDQMRRADSVANSSLTALVTFVDNIHKWQASNVMPTPVPTATSTPKPTLTPTKTPPPKPKTPPSHQQGFAVVGMSATLLVLVAILTVFKRRRGKSQRDFMFRGG